MRLRRTLPTFCLLLAAGLGGCRGRPPGQTDETLARRVAVKILPKLSVRDLRSMSKDRNVSDGVRSAAGRLYRIKTK